jgi:hypothetical protein
MRRVAKKKKPGTQDGDLRDEYDPSLIRKGVRGKYAAAYRAGIGLVRRKSKIPLRGES